MPDKTTLFCIGHSHVTCVEQAAVEQGTPLTAINFWTHRDILAAVGEHRWRLTEKGTKLIERHGGPIFSLIGGACHGVMGMLRHPQPWDFVLPDSPDLPLCSDAICLPYDTVRATMLGMMREYLDITEQVMRVSSGRVFHIEPPPPFVDSERITPHVFWPLFPGMQHVVSPAAFRYKLWRLQSTLIEAHCDEHGINFIPAPAVAMDDLGFMCEGYFLDGAHANTAYGALVLEQMRTLHDPSI